MHEKLYTETYTTYSLTYLFMYVFIYSFICFYLFAIGSNQVATSSQHIFDNLKVVDLLKHA